jgi:type II secretory pathway pseudopilin PulG
MNVSMRTRLMLTTSVIVMVLVGVLSTGIYSTFSRQLVRQVDKSLDDRVVMIADSLRRANSMPDVVCVILWTKRFFQLDSTLSLKLLMSMER